jgi:ATP-binding cassette subfamily F protein 3
MEDSLATAELYRDPNRFREVVKEFEEGKTKLQQLYEHWEEAVELNSR